MNNIITLLKPNHLNIFTNYFTINKKHGKKTKRLLNKLKKLKVLEPYKYQELVHQGKHINIATITDYIFQAEKDLYNYLGKGGEVLIIGANTLSKFKLENEYFTFHTTYKNGFKILGLHVIVVPWIEGLIVLPKHIYHHNLIFHNE